LIPEYCRQNLPPDPVWISALSRHFPRFAARLDGAASVQREIEDHLRNSYEAGLLKGQDPESAWQLARDHFGDIARIAQEVRKARAQSCKCLATRFLAVLALVFLPLGKIARLQIPTFIHVPSFGLMAACAAIGYLITRKRDFISLRKYALYGAWLGLLWGIGRVLTIKDASEMGAPIAMILLSTFYGLFFAAPTARGAMTTLMMVLCQFGVLASLARIGMLSLHPHAVDAAFLKMVAEFSIVAVLVGLIVFGIRKLHLRLAGVAVFGMVFAQMQILSNMTSSNSALLDFMCATSIPPLMAVLIVLPIYRLQEHLLQKAN